MALLASSVRMDVERGPDWLFIRPLPGEAPAEAAQSAPREPFVLSDRVWNACAQHFTYRVVLELEALGSLTGTMVEDLAGLRERLQSAGGLLRLCGLSRECEELIGERRLDGQLPSYRNRVEAIRGFRPPQPR